MEFIPMLSLLRHRYKPATLPYHFIIPSLPGYAFSSPQPIGKDLSQTDVARIMDSLAHALGFGKGYLVQGGDVGSRVARCMGAEMEGCKGMYRYIPSIDTISMAFV
jgi:microsomal epoxide hydrolase